MLYFQLKGVSISLPYPLSVVVPASQEVCVGDGIDSNGLLYESIREQAARPGVNPKVS